MNIKKLNDLKTKAIEILRVNSLGSSTKPAPHLYPHQWNWDSAFIAIGMSHYDEEQAQKEIFTLLDGQWENGMVPHIIFNDQSGDYHPGPKYWDSASAEDSPSTVNTSGISQPPILAYAAYQIFKYSKDKKRATLFLKTIFPKLKKYHQFFYSNRDPLAEGLAHIIHPWESGLDNSPRWDEPLQQIKLEWIPHFRRVDTNKVSSEQRPTDEEYIKYTYLVELFRKEKYNQEKIWQKKAFAVQPILFNSLIYASLNSLQEIGGFLGEDISEIQSWMIQTKESINNKLWDEDNKKYGDYDLIGTRKILKNTVAMFIPLFAEIPSLDRAELLVNSLTSPDYWPEMGYPICSVSLRDQDFNPVKYWRGPVWININWLLIQGLINYGYSQKAQELTEKTLELVHKNSFCEYYHPLTGEACGATMFSWSAALVIDLIYKLTGDIY